MAILVNNLLDVHSIASITEVLAAPNIFHDGQKTAGKTARAVKSNLQADSKSLQVQGACKLIEKKLRGHALVKHAAFPKKFAKIMLNCYQPGMSYGDHIDDATIAGVRTDLAFTLFLSAPESYEGGELVLKKHDGEDAIKLPAGALYLYSADTIHRVNPVLSGSRLAAVGWLQSRVRLAQHRTILFDLYCALQQLPNSEENRHSRLGLLQVQSNLQRLWLD